jgi:lambda repressor-like predicted transcriptional regulator
MVRQAPLDDYLVEPRPPARGGHDRSPSAFIVFVKLWHDAGGAGRRIQVSLSTLAVETGLSKSSVQSALKRLQRRAYIGMKRASATAIPVYTIHAPWRS